MLIISILTKFLYLFGMESLILNIISLKNWTLTTMYGWLIGFVCVILLVLIADAVGISNSQFFVGTGMAAGVGFMQNRLLRRKYNWNWNWMWTTIAGMTLAFIILEFGSNLTEKLPEFDLQLSVALGGLFVGVLQYLILKTKTIVSSLWWILICFAGWSFAGLIVGIVDILNDYIPRGPIGLILNLLLMVFVSSLVLGLITGKGIIRLLHKKI